MQRFKLGLVALVLLAGLLSACGGDTNPTATAVPAPTSAPTLAATATVPAAPASDTPAAAKSTDTPAPPAATATLAPANATDTPAPPAATATLAPANATDTPAAAGPTSTVPPGAAATNTIVAATSPTALFVVPTAPPTAVPTVIPLQAHSSGGKPDYATELKAYWDLFYKARTLAPGGKLDLATVGSLTAPPYRDYTLALLDKSQADADAGKLRQISYSDLKIEDITAQDPGPDGSTVVVVTISRTQTQVRTDSNVPAQNLSLVFRLRRTPGPGGTVSWQAFDFFNPANSAWLSDSMSSSLVSPAQLQSELNAYFARFYAARSLQPGGQFDLATTGEITLFAYQDYTLPLLQQQQDEATAGKLTAVRYSDIAVKVEKWDPQATNHGGIVTVTVTRTSHVQRPGQPEDVQTASYQFRLHRHQGEDAKPFWVAVDFLSPITGKWVSESAGLSGPVPPSGHG